MFFSLAMRLPAYQGALAAIAARQQREGSGGQKQAPKYERGSQMANNARMANQAPAATAGALATVNAQLGGGWISHRTVKADSSAGGGDTQ